MGDGVVVNIIRFKADEGTHDTASMYNIEKVSYGAEVEAKLSDFITIKFEDNEITKTRIDERNLI